MLSEMRRGTAVIVQNVGNYINDNQRRYKDGREGKSSNAIIQIWHVSALERRLTRAVSTIP